ncbi:MAG: hypothetical protein RL748_1932 [Pseudomonadota bacterium]|jgi:hypothetical protein
MVTKAIEAKSTEMNADEMKEYLEIKAMLERDKDKIMQDAAILAFKFRQASKSSTRFNGRK